MGGMTSCCPGDSTSAQEVVVSTQPDASGSGEVSAKPSLTQHGTQFMTNSAAKAAPAIPFPQRPRNSTLSEELWGKSEKLFHVMDTDNSNGVTRAEAIAFFHGAFKKMSVDAMFNEVDTDHSDVISADEFMKFWKGVRVAGYSDQEIQDEMDELIEGNAWVDWNDGRNVNTKHATFPKRPWLCRLSKKAWMKCEELFVKMDGNGNMVISKNEGERLFTNGFSKISTNAMFNELDVDQNGSITAKEFMKFWVNVKGSGYKESLIIEEIENLLQGGAWVDWNDGRRT